MDGLIHSNHESNNTEHTNYKKAGVLLILDPTSAGITGQGDFRSEPSSAKAMWRAGRPVRMDPSG